MIFDKLENGVKDTPFKHVVSGIFGGKFSTKLICSNCQFVSANEEQFYNLSLEVKNLRTLYQSLDKFITKEIISDYKCSSCKTVAETAKVACLSQLPNVLVVHLQRIVYDLDLFINVKINSKLEFPMHLNMRPYSSAAQ